MWGCGGVSGAHAEDQGGGGESANLEAARSRLWLAGAELPRVARRALRRYGSRAGALPRGGTLTVLPCSETLAGRKLWCAWLGLGVGVGVGVGLGAGLSLGFGLGSGLGLGLALGFG